jgi:hypothetical protein
MMTTLAVVAPIAALTVMLANGTPADVDSVVVARPEALVVAVKLVKVPRPPGSTLVKVTVRPDKGLPSFETNAVSVVLLPAAMSEGFAVRVILTLCAVSV